MSRGLHGLLSSCTLLPSHSNTPLLSNTIVIYDHYPHKPSLRSPCLIFFIAILKKSLLYFLNKKWEFVGVLIFPCPLKLYSWIEWDHPYSQWDVSWLTTWTTNLGLARWIAWGLPTTKPPPCVIEVLAWNVSQNTQSYISRKLLKLSNTCAI